ncbi:3-oxoacyl-ACP reductase FabG [Bacillus sp. Marseille-P3661]|uniref:3-oxoacyl-ACP reductase FabG n=1 Tax=Bacillus sp. Marseille-P3661 TaxID=1936234 RepID=UPI000C839901|nr:3-oxoacyl-ACP reductase FabG [Bacillus sp. Marseille-P3661]
MRLTDKVAIVTGGANGLGKQTVLRFSEEGAKVVIADFDETKAQQVLHEVKELDGEAIFLKVDVTDPDSVEKMVQATLQSFMKIDILINNAGITNDAMLSKLTADAWKKVLDVNLSGVFHCTQAVIPTMLQQGYGKIINTSSVSGVYGNIGQTNYAATKAGVIGLTKTWAKELGFKGIRVNAVAPGFIETDMTKTIPAKIIERLKEQVPLRRLGKPIDVANAYLYLASDESDYVNGIVLHVDGGIVM